MGFITSIFGNSAALQGSSQASVQGVRLGIRYGTTASLLLEQICPVGTSCKAMLAVSRAGEKEASLAIILESPVGSVRLEIVDGKLGLSTSLASCVRDTEDVKFVLDAAVLATLWKIHEAFTEVGLQEVDSSFRDFGKDIFGDKLFQ